MKSQVTKNKINVLYILDERYAPLGTISMVSMLINNSEELDIWIKVLERDLKEETKKRIKSMVTSYDAHIEFYKCNEIDEYLEKLKISKYHGGYVIYYRLFFERYLKNSENELLLYVDADTIIAGKIVGLVNQYERMKAQKCVLGMVYENNAPLNFLYKKWADLPKDALICNSGVLLINTEAWREKAYSKRIIHFLQSIGEDKRFLTGDQDIINIIFDRRDLFILSPEYNWGTRCNYLGYRRYKRQIKPLDDAYYKEEEIKKACEAPVICHCLTGFYGRPWEVGNTSPYKKLFEKYKSMTWFAGEQLQISDISKSQKIQKWLYRCLPEYIFDNLFRILKIIDFKVNHSSKAHRKIIEYKSNL